MEHMNGVVVTELERNESYVLKKLELASHGKIAWHRHKAKPESYVVTHGGGVMLTAEEGATEGITFLHVGDVILVPVGKWHAVIADKSGLIIIEPQGTDTEDIEWRGED